MEKAFKLLNELKQKGLIKHYAIGGGMGATFYVEPVLTYDLDVFITLPKQQGALVTLSPVYEHLRKKGYRARAEYVQVGDVPVQFIPAYNDLVEEAVVEARGVSYKGTRTRILRVEHLLAIMLQTNRPKDRVRIALILDEGKINTAYLEDVLKRHGLLTKWRTIVRGHHA